MKKADRLKERYYDLKKGNKLRYNVLRDLKELMFFSFERIELSKSAEEAIKWKEMHKIFYKLFAELFDDFGRHL